MPGGAAGLTDHLQASALLLSQLVGGGGEEEEDGGSSGGDGCSGLASPVVCGGGRWEEVMLVPLPPVCSGLGPLENSQSMTQRVAESSRASLHSTDTDRPPASHHKLSHLIITFFLRAHIITSHTRSLSPGLKHLVFPVFPALFSLSVLAPCLSIKIVYRMCYVGQSNLPGK